MIKVAVTDYTFPSLDIESKILQPLGCTIEAGQCRTSADLIELVNDADHVITQFARLTSDVIASMQKAKVIVRYGIGVDNVDLEAARHVGIPVCNVPTYCIEEVADHTLALILSATRQLPSNSGSVRYGKWSLAVSLEEMKTLSDLTTGVVGFGRIGRAVVERLVPFKGRILVSDPLVSSTDVKDLGGTLAEFDRLIADSDLITLHCPSTPETQHMMNRESIARMKQGAILVNAARGDLVDTEALVEALMSGQLGFAALDVCDPEPIPPDSPLLGMKNFLATSHIASTSAKAHRLLRQTVAEIVATSIRGEPLPNVVNSIAS